MIGVAVVAVAHQFCIDLCPTGFGVFQFFQDQDPSPFPHDKAAALLIERTGSFFRRIIFPGQGFHVVEPGHRNGRNGSFRPAGQHHIRISVLDGPECIPDAVRAGRAGGDDGRIGAFHLQIDGNLGRRHIGDFHGNEERTDPAGSLFHQFRSRIQESMDPADAGAYAHTDPVRIFLFQIQAGVFYRHFGTGHGELGHTIHPFAFFPVAVIGKIEVFDFPGDFTVKISGIELGNQPNTGFAFHQAVPECFFADTNGRNRTEAGHYHSSFQQDHLYLILSKSSLIRLKIS